MKYRARITISDRPIRYPHKVEFWDIEKDILDEKLTKNFIRESDAKAYLHKIAGAEIGYHIVAEQR